MCRLLGIYGEVDDWQTVVLEFGKLAEHGDVPPSSRSPGHKDGWGMARSSEDRNAMVEVIRRMGSAHEAPEYGNSLMAIGRQPRVFLCHLRKASPGIPVTIANVHPFFSSGWALIHNGTIHNPADLPASPTFKPASDGSDTERLLAYLTGVLLRIDSKEARSDALADALQQLNISYTGINCILSDGSELYAIRDYQEMGDYLSLYHYCLPKGVIVCSEPLHVQGLDRCRWRPLENRSLIRIHDAPPKIETRNYQRPRKV